MLKWVEDNFAKFQAGESFVAEEGWLLSQLRKSNSSQHKLMQRPSQSPAQHPSPQPETVEIYGFRSQISSLAGVPPPQSQKEREREREICQCQCWNDEQMTAVEHMVQEFSTW